MEQIVVETAPSTICEISNENKAKKRKKRKSSAIDVDCTIQSDDISLQKRSCYEGDLSSEDRKSNAVALSLKEEGNLSRRERKRLKKEKARLNAGSNCSPGDNCSEDKSHHEGDLSLSHTTDVSILTNAEVSNPQTKGNGKDGNERKLEEKGKSQASQGGESDILNESCKIEIAPLPLSNQTTEHSAKKRKKSKKRNSSVSNPDRNGNPDQADAEVSQINQDGNSHADREAGDGIVTYDSTTASHNDCCASEDGKSNAVAPSLNTEVTLSTIRQGKGESRRERKRQKGKDAILNAGSNCKPEDNCLQDKSHSGGEVSNQQTKENGKDGKERELAKKGKSHDPQGGELDILSEACKIQMGPSVLINQSMEHNAKKRKKSKKRNKSISNADSNCNPDQANVEVSQDQGKESIKAESSHMDREAAVGIVTIDSNAASHNNGCASEDGNSNIASQSCNIETALSTICDQSKEHKTKKRKRKKSRKIDDSISNAESNCDPAISFREKSSFGGEAAVDQSCVSSDMILPSFVVKEPRTSNRKLLILDLNGLLADIVKKPSKPGYPRYKPHIRIGKNGVFTRPFCDEFLEFCLDTFDVGVWSSRMRSNVELIVHCLFGDKRNRLLLCWDGSHCTQTGCQTPGKRHKPIVLKELRKLWEKGDPQRPWKVGDYDESNTLLIDDSPCKAVCNPPNTGIFPHPYRNSNLEDNSLGPNGELRLYLERLATADNVQRFVAENPIGQRAITNKSPNWSFYSKIIEANVEVSQDQKKESIKAESSHIDREAAFGIVTFDSNAASHNNGCASEDGNSNIASQSFNIETAPSTICDQSKEHKTMKRKRKKSRKIDDSLSNAQSNCDPAISFREKSSFGGEAALDQSCVSSDVILPSLVKEPRPSNRKLIILDLNGLLADIVKNPCKPGFPNYKPHTRVGMNGVFTRPFCDEFLDFCLDTFDVGVWSSRMRFNVELIVQCLFGDKRNRLLFCWDGSHCTPTGCQTPGKRYKPLVFKELRKLWENGDPQRPWKVGDYDESNTVLIDDSPCKAVCNPPNTGIFPHPYRNSNLEDNSLGPNGELRLYLERLATADNVQRFVAENPIGQRAITNKSPNWSFYSKIIEANRSKVL